MQDLVRWGHWQRLHFGAYAAFTGEPTRGAVLWAAVLRTGPRSILSHETAAELDGLLDKHSTLIHVTVPVQQHMRPVAGLAIHRSRRIIDVRRQRLLPPRTMTEETVLDLAGAAASFDEVVSLLARACQRRLTTPFLIGENLERRAKQPWRAEIGQALTDVASGVHSGLEYRYLRDVERAHGLPTAQRQARRPGRATHLPRRPLPQVRGGRGTRRKCQPSRRAALARSSPRQRGGRRRSRYAPVRLGRRHRAPV